jgi:hypothetical protein
MRAEMKERGETMTTEAQVQVTRTVTVTVKEAAKQAAKGDFPADYKLTVDSPFFQSKQPTVLYVPLDIGNDVEPGQDLNMVIRSEGIKEVKEGSQPYDGMKPWMHKWRFVRLAGDDDDAPSQPRFTSTPARTDPAGISIERQVAAKAATELLCNGIVALEHAEIPLSQHWDIWFDHIISRIQGTSTTTASLGQD